VTPRPLVLLGHGGSGDKSTMAGLAARLAGQEGFVVAAIDGPVHGDRRSDGAPREQVLAEFRALWREGTPRVDEMAADWRAAVDYLVTLPEVDPQRIGWAGVSMGTGYGLPFVAAEPRVRAALLGMWGLSYPSSERLAADAPRVRCPVLFQRKAEDELFTVEGQEELFGLIGSPDKRIVVYPGGHVSPEGAQLEDIVAFLADQLRTPAASL
jgi:dienelactone hydrolase